MGIISSLFEKRNSLPLDNPEPWRAAGLLGTSTSGIRVTSGNALSYTAVLAAVRVLSEAVASPPLITYQQVGRGKDRAKDYYLYTLLHDAPNPEMTSFEFREVLQGHLCLWGNAYALLDITLRGKISAMWPLLPHKMLQMIRKDGGLFYRYHMPDGKIEDIPSYKIWHLRGYSPDGLIGYNPISLQKDSIGLGKAAEQFGNTFYGNGARPGGVLGDDAHDRLRESWNNAHQGVSRANKVAILEEGLTYKPIGVPPEEAQFLETRRFQVSEVARAFRVPPHMIGDLEKATFSNIEQQSLEFITYVMYPWYSRWEQSIKQNLMSVRDKEIYFTEFLIEGFLRGDSTARSAFYGSMFNIGAMSQNDVREKENMNPIDGGDVYYVPLNMVPMEMAGQPREAAPDPDPERALPDSEMRGVAKLPGKEQRGIAKRRKLQTSFEPQFLDVIARILRREANDVGNAGRRIIPSGADAFREWMDEFYTEHEAFVRRQFAPVMEAYAALVSDEVMDEVDRQVADDLINTFAQRYIEAFASRHVGKSKADLERSLAADDIMADFEERLSGWRELRPSTEAHGEVVRGNNAIAKLVYSAAGVTVLRWVAIGKSCPYCSEMDGVTVGIESNFVESGADYQPVGASAPLRPSSNIGHPPLHRGCDCMIIGG
jgi:HK97 family phage portal protein